MRTRLFMAALLATLAHGRDGGAATPLPTPASLAVRPTAEPFNLTQVRLLDGPFRDAMLRNRQYLVNLDPDRLLHMFRVTAGLPSAAAPYGGWEAPSVELRGHTLGHYLSALALLYASTGLPFAPKGSDGPTM